MYYTVEDANGNWGWSGWAKDTAQAEVFARACNPHSISPTERLVVAG